MRRVIYLIGLLFCSVQLNAQKHINMIIVIDDNVSLHEMTGLELIAVREDGREEIINADYYPGDLILSDDDYEKLLNPAIRTVYLSFYCENNRSSYYDEYKIEIYTSWLTDYFHIIRIYNTTKKKYRNMFCVLTGRKYVYEIENPNGAARLVRKRPPPP